MFIEKVHLMKNHSTKQWDYIWILKFTPQNDNLVYESIWQNAWQAHSRQTPFFKMLEIHSTGIKHKIIFYDEEKYLNENNQQIPICYHYPCGKISKNGFDCIFYAEYKLFMKYMTPPLQLKVLD